MLKVAGRLASSNVQKVYWACAELGLDFEPMDFGGRFGGARTAEYLALNPNGLVPTIDDDGFVLWESHSIVRYLASVHAPGTLWPTDPRVRADAERWMDWQLTVLGPASRPVYWATVRTAEADRDLDALAAARDDLGAAFAILDSALAGSPYVAGDDFTMGDIPVGITTYRWFAMPIEREDYPHLKRWYDALTERPGYREHIMKPLE